MNAQDVHGNTALHLTCDERVANKLLAKGADTGLLNNKGESIVMCHLQHLKTVILYAKYKHVNAQVKDCQGNVFAHFLHEQMARVEYTREELIEAYFGIDNAVDMLYSVVNNHGKTSIMSILESHALDAYLECLVSHIDNFWKRQVHPEQAILPLDHICHQNEDMDWKLLFSLFPLEFLRLESMKPCALHHLTRTKKSCGNLQLFESWIQLPIVLQMLNHVAVLDHVTCTPLMLLYEHCDAKHVRVAVVNGAIGIPGWSLVEKLGQDAKLPMIIELMREDEAAHDGHVTISHDQLLQILSIPQVWTHPSMEHLIACLAGENYLQELATRQFLHTCLKLVDDVTLEHIVILHPSMSDAQWKLVFASVDADQNTCLHIVAQYNNQMVNQMQWLVEFLIQVCNVDAQNSNGDTALHIACEKQHKAIVKLLLEANAKCDIQNKQNKTAKMIMPSYFAKPKRKRNVEDDDEYHPVEKKQRRK